MGIQVHKAAQLCEPETSVVGYTIDLCLRCFLVSIRNRLPSRCRFNRTFDRSTGRSIRVGSQLVQHNGHFGREGDDHRAALVIIIVMTMMSQMEDLVQRLRNLQATATPRRTLLNKVILQHEICRRDVATDGAIIGSDRIVSYIVNRRQIRFGHLRISVETIVCKQAIKVRLIDGS